MIRELAISNLGVIEHTRLSFSPGLTVLTGETGAGKTLVTTAVGQLLGSKPDADLVRHGADEAVIECLMTPAAGVVAQLDEIGAVLDGDELIVSRSIGSSTRSRAVVGSRAVAAATMAEIVGASVTLHGQHGQTRLTRASEQRALLDGAAGLEAELDAQRHVWQRVRDVRQQLLEAQSQQSSTAATLGRLRELVNDVDGVAPKPGEDVELADRIAMLASVDEVQRLCRVAQAALVGDGETDLSDAFGLIAGVRKQFEQTNLAGPFATWAERTVELGELIAELAHDIDQFAADLDVDPATLDSLQQRKAAVAGLLRRWNLPLSSLLAEYEEAQRQLAFADDPAARLAELEHALSEAETQQERACAALHAKRVEAAAALSQAVTAELRELGLPSAMFSIDVRRNGDPTQFGDDQIEFRFTANPGLPAQALASVGSGGELSRVMLALEVAAAEGRGRTFVFDEVDAGIGGKAALEVGKRLAILAAHHQVIVVTHLPQVAAFAEAHIVVEKMADGHRTSTTTRTLGSADRAQEIARMLSGVESSASAVAHADELLRMADDVRRVVR